MAKNLWKLDRGGDASAPSAEPAEAVSQATEFEPVGDVLRARREERGEDLRYVAQILRIRYPYLKAIEDSLIDELPGPTYAIGFVRTYGEHLGLDSHDLVTRFKAEVDGLNARSDLHFPAPIPEGGVPSGAVLIIAVVMAFGIFGTWSYLSAPDDTVAEVVPTMPVDASDTANAVSVPPPATAADAEAKAADVADKARAAPPVPKTEMKEAVASKKDVPPAPVAAAPDPAERKSESLAAAPSIAASVARARARAAEAPSDPVAPPAATDTTNTVPETPASDSIAAIQPSIPSPADTDGAISRTPKNYGASQGDNRIMVEAIADSWVEVRDRKTDELLLTRVLFKGDRYYVPNRQGLSLLTGNAGGLRIFVDGESAPAIGPVGSVRRDVPLEPDSLKGGSADTGDGSAATVDSPPETSPQ